MDAVQRIADSLVGNVDKVIIGKSREVRLVLIALLCRGHVLVEDVPGVGKTMMAKAISRSLGSSFKRIQFTPDLLPSDVTGVSIFNLKESDFEFRPGPVFAQIVLADEINRATPKTQSALLEAMEESQVTVDGTFPLPEAQLDRFLVRLSLGYPGRQNEIAILDSQRHQHPIDSVSKVIEVDELVAAQTKVKQVHVDDRLREYIVDIVEATREHDHTYLGASPRGTIALRDTARAWAAIQGREYIIPDDIKDLAEPTLAHRVIINPAARMRNIDSRAVIRDIISTLPVPGSGREATSVGSPGRGWRGRGNS
jgi:MoxR-like ATPase